LPPPARLPPGCFDSQPGTIGRTLIVTVACSTIVDERQRHARRRSRLDLSNGIRLAPLTTVADDLRTMLRSPEAASSGAAKEQWTRQTDIDAWLIWNIWQVANSACRMGCKALHGGDRYSNPERHELVDSAIERPLSVPSL